MTATVQSGCLTFEGTSSALSAALWGQIQASYPLVPPRPKGASAVLSEVALLCGQLESVSAEDALAVAITDLRSGVRTEVGVAPVGEGTAALFWRLLAPAACAPKPEPGRSGLPGVVAAAIADAGGRCEPRLPKLQPTFSAMAAQMLAHSGSRILLPDPEALEQARTDVEYWKQLGTGQSQAARTARMELEQLRSQLLGALPPERRSAEPDGHPTTQRAWKLRDLAEWAALNSERIIVHQRAVGASRRSLYEDDKLVYEALEFLAGDYSAMRRGELPMEHAQDKLRRLGLELSRSIDPARSFEEGEQYFVRWGGRRHFLRWHLRRGVSRDPRFSLRIYFCWVEEVQRVLVGSLPAHLDTRIT